MDDPTQGGATAMATPAPAASTPSAPPPSGDMGSGDKSWQQAAATAGTSASASPAQPTASTPNAAPVPPPAVTAVAAPPAEAKPVYAPGLRGFMDKMIDSLAGTPTSKVRQAADGSVYLEHEPVRGQPGFSSGKQWLRIGAEALLGAAAGMSQRGAGSEGQALGAGMQAGQKFQQQRQEAPSQELVQLANISALNHQTAANALELTRKGIEGQQHDIDFSEKQADRLTAAGATQVGHAANLQELTKFMRDTPQFNQDQTKTALYTPVATYGADGKPNGFDIYKKLPGSDEEMQPAGTEVPWFNPVKNEIEYQKSAGPLKQGDVNALWAAAGNARHKYQLDQSQIDERNAAADAKLHPQAKPETPDVIAKNISIANKNNKGGGAGAGTGGNGAQGAQEAQPSDDNLIHMAGSGQMDMGNWGYMLARMKDPAFLKRVTAIYPDMDTSKIKRYMKAADEFTSSDKGAGKQLNNGSTAINHLGELYDAASASSLIPYSTDNNKTTTLKAGIVGELGQFYGESTIPGQTRFEKGIGSMVPSARKDAIIEQIRMLGDKMSSFQQQWKNSMPSSHYSRPMPGLSPEAMRTWMTLDPTGAKNFQRHQDELDMSKNGSASGQGQPAAAALTNLHTNPTTGQTIGWNGQQYVDTKTGQAVK